MMATADDTTPAARAPHRAERTCVGCGKHAAREDLVRLVLDPVACSVVVDAKDGAFGRGAHVHPSVDCVSNVKKGLSRSFKREVNVEPEALARSIADAFARRLEGLLSGGVRAGHVAVGGDAVEESLRSGKAKLVLIAADAKGKPPTPDALVYGDKMRLARALQKKSAQERDGVAVCSITNVALATAVRAAWLRAAGVLKNERSRRAPSAGGNE